MIFVPMSWKYFQIKNCADGMMFLLGSKRCVGAILGESENY